MNHTVIAQRGFRTGAVFLKSNGDEYVFDGYKSVAQSGTKHDGQFYMEHILQCFPKGVLKLIAGGVFCFYFIFYKEDKSIGTRSNTLTLAAPRM